MMGLGAAPRPQYAPRPRLRHLPPGGGDRPAAGRPAGRERGDRQALDARRWQSSAIRRTISARPARWWTACWRRADGNASWRKVSCRSARKSKPSSGPPGTTARRACSRPGPNGPNISPKGSMVVFDDEHLAYWERSKKQALENLGHDKRVCVMYANFKAQRDGVLSRVSCAFTAPPSCTRAGRSATPSSSCCCRASRPMSAPTPASACWSRSSAPPTCAASRCRNEPRYGGDGARLRTAIM